MKEHKHLGCYGLLIEGNKVLLIKKKTGPYDGLLDLPGGSLEFGETPEIALKREFMEETGLDITKYSVHKLRHTAATLMYQYGNVDIRALQELLGHESISTTEIYTHVNDERIRDAVENNPLANI